MALAVFGTLLLAALSGCGGKSDEPIVESTDRPGLAADKGAIAGLLIDDRYRPVPDALILLTPVGLTATTDSAGQFEFLDLQPGAYVMQIQVDDHEAAPVTVDINGGQYTESEIQARRMFSEAGNIITTQFSAFIPCQANFIVNGVNANCVVDLSGDSFRDGFVTAKLNKTLNWTVMVSEVLLNQVGDFQFQVREDNGEVGGGERYGTVDIVDSAYGKIVNHRGKISEQNVQRNAVPFNGTKPFDTVVFLTGEFKDESQGAFDSVCQPSVPQTCRTTTGAGAAFGVKARMIQSLFIGEPTQPITTYCLLAPEGQCA